MTMPSDDYGSDGFNPYEAEADADPTVSLTGNPGRDMDQEGGALPIEAREMMLEMKARQLSQAAEQRAVFDGMEQFYNTSVAAKHQELLSQGVPARTAAKLAEDYAKQATDAGAKDLLRRRTATELVSQQTGLDPRMFKGLWDEHAMRQRAQQLMALASPEGQQMYQSWAQMQMAQQQLQQNGVPYQNYNRPGRGAMGNNPARLRQQYADGLIGWSPQVQKAIDG